MHIIGSVPSIRCFLRKEYLYNLESHHGEFIECVWIGITSIHNKAIGFRAITSEGAQFNNLPINAFCSKKDSSPLPLDICELWDCFSYDLGVHQFKWLRQKKCQVLLKDKSIVWGTYLFTITWANPSLESDGFNYAEDSDTKDAHIIELDSGQFVAQPNNRIRWHDFDFITNPLDLSKNPGYKILNQKFICENSEKWRVSDTDSFFYDIIKKMEK